MKIDKFNMIIKIKGNPEKLKKIILAIVITVIMIFSAIVYFSNSDNSSYEIYKHETEVQLPKRLINADSEHNNIDSNNVKGGNNNTDIIYVDIGGEVNNPGVVTLKLGDIVLNAIDAAGGLTDKAVTKYINRATKLSDGDKIYIPTQAEIDNPEFNELLSKSNNANSSSSNVNSANEKININTADLENLQKLTGVGPSTAQKIIDYRESNGKFSSIEDLMNVSGIGEKTFAKMKEHITV